MISSSKFQVGAVLNTSVMKTKQNISSTKGVFNKKVEVGMEWDGRKFEVLFQTFHGEVALTI